MAGSETFQKDTESVINAKYMCPYCEHILLQACQTNCGHRLCKDCLDKLIDQEKSSARCPISDCRELLNENLDQYGSLYFPDRSFRREMDVLIVPCPLEGCRWIGQLRRHEEHKKTHHPSFTVKPVTRKRAREMLVATVDTEKVESTQDDLVTLTEQLLKKTKEQGEALRTQRRNSSAVIRESDEDSKKCGLQSTGGPSRTDKRSVWKECSNTLKPHTYLMDEVVPDFDTAALTQGRAGSFGLAPQALVVPHYLSRPTPIGYPNAAMDQSQVREDLSRPASELPVIENAQRVTQRKNSDTMSSKAIAPVVTLPHLTTNTTSSDNQYYNMQGTTEAIEVSSSRPPRSRNTPSASPRRRIRKISPPSPYLPRKGSVSSSFPSQRPPSPCASVVERTPALTEPLCAQFSCCCNLCECAKTREELKTERSKRKNLESIIKREISEKRLSTQPRKLLHMHTSVSYSTYRKRLFSI